MNHDQYSELRALCKEVFPTELFNDRVKSAAEREGFHFVMRILRLSRVVSTSLGWEKASYSLFEAIMNGEIQTRTFEWDG